VVVLPSVHTKSLDTITHTAMTTTHLLRHRPDAVVMFGVGNSPFAWTMTKAKIPVVLNVDGLDRARAKWGGTARRYLHWTERLAPRACDVLVTDARTIEQYYLDSYGVTSTFIAYGAPSGPATADDQIVALGLDPGRYILYVSRLEPENNAHVLIDAYNQSGIETPLVIVGGAAYGDEYEERLHTTAGPGVRFLGFVFGEGYVQLQSHARVYVQCTEIGGTHPALVEAMGYGNAIVALDTPEHREVLGEAGMYYGDRDELTKELAALDIDAAARMALAAAARDRAESTFSWDAVADRYVEACARAAGR
jgi:glycosyltransferase involved in cell wall biosynthesis